MSFKPDRIDVITYVKDFLSPLDADALFCQLRDDLAWVRHADAPRCEYYVNSFGHPYTYGQNKGRRTYAAQPMHPAIARIKQQAEFITSLRLNVVTRFEVCFLNRYLNQSDHLGWHSDNSPEMDDARPIAIVSLGVERQIWFRPIPDVGETQEANTVAKLLQHGSLCIMPPGFQDKQQHRIPKSSRQCGERISLTFRGYVDLSIPVKQPTRRDAVGPADTVMGEN